MLSIEKALILNSKDELVKHLIEYVEIRDIMSNIISRSNMNKECYEIVDKCFELGVDITTIRKILKEDNFYR